MTSCTVGLLNNQLQPAYMIRNAFVSKQSQLVVLLRRVESLWSHRVVGMCGLPESDSDVRLGTLMTLAMTSLVAHRVGGGGDDGAAVDRLQSGHAETRPSVITLVCVQRLG